MPIAHLGIYYSPTYEQQQNNDAAPRAKSFFEQQFFLLIFWKWLQRLKGKGNKYLSEIQTLPRAKSNPPWQFKGNNWF